MYKITKELKYIVNETILDYLHYFMTQEVIYVKLIRETK